MPRQHAAAMLLFTCIALLAVPASAQWKYPPTPTSDAVDVFNGKRYLDPYRPLENLQNKPVEAWFRAQARLTDDLLARLPGRDALVREWVALDKKTPPKYADIQVEGAQVFYRKTLGGENVGKLYRRDGYKGTEQLLFDPTNYKPGAHATLTFFAPSFDAKHVLLGLSAGGAEWSELRVLRVVDGTLLPDRIEAAEWFGASWLADGASFTYSGSDVKDVKDPSIELNRQARMHRLGTPVGSDRDLLSNASTAELGIAPKEIPVVQELEVEPDRLLGFIYTVSPDQRIYTARASDLAEGHLAWKSVSQPGDHLVRGAVVHDGWLYGVTHDRAPRYRVVRSRIDVPDWKIAETVIPEAADSIEGITQSKDFMLVQYSDGVVGRVVQYNLSTGALRELKLPTSGAVDINCPDAHSNICLVGVTGWIQPRVIYQLDADSGNISISSLSTEVEYPEFADVVSEEVEVLGHDGTMIPLSILHRKDIPMDGSSPCILEGYGAYGISYTPAFNIRHSIVRHGVVVAYAHVRGGSEKGDAWYKAGYKTTKANTWKDFVSTAEYLIAKGYTRSDRLSGRGTSAGGILISRAITERPDLFSSAVVNVGLANALRAEFSPNGPINTPEFGSTQDPAETQALYEMDGLQHVQSGVRYPAVLGIAGWNDPRVAAWQPGKFVAAVQQASTSGKPSLLLVNFDNGHFTEEKTVTYRNFANQFAFALWQAGHREFQPLPVAAASTKKAVPASQLGPVIRRQMHRWSSVGHR